MAQIQISPGNMKMPGIPGTSIRPVADCVNCSECASVCYAMKAYRAYPSARNAWKQNSTLLRYDMASYFEQLASWLDRKQPTWFRIHVAGDFISAEHVDNWVLIAELFPNTRFLAFSKAFQFLPATASFPSNLQIVLSLFPDMGVPDHAGYARAYAGELENYPTDRRCAKALHCPGNCATCGVCWSLSQRGLDVRFSLH